MGLRRAFQAPHITTKPGTKIMAVKRYERVIGLKMGAADFGLSRPSWSKLYFRVDVLSYVDLVPGNLAQMSDESRQGRGSKRVGRV